MPLQKVKTYQVCKSADNLDSLIESISESGLTYQILNPKELGSSWSQAVEIPNVIDINNTRKIDLLDKAARLFQVKSPFSAILDQRENLRLQQIKKITEKEDYLLDFARFFIDYKEKLQLFENVKAISKSVKNDFIFSSSLNSEISPFIKFIENFNKNHSSVLEVSQNLPKVLKIKDLEYITSDYENFDLFCSFLDDVDSKKVFYYSKFIKTIEEEVSNCEKKVESYSTSGKNNTSKLKKEVIELHAYYDLVNEVSKIRSKFFTLDSSSNKAFGFIAIVDKEAPMLTKIFEEHDVVFEEVTWDKEIVNWVNPTGLSGFQGVVEPLGTISKKEFDPTIVVSVFFMLFFAFCLGDALYGSIIALITGYFLYFTKLKKELRSVFSLFFFSGLATVIYGALINSWAGNLFAPTQLGPTLELFALIDPLTQEAALPINQLLKDSGGTHPIVFMMALSLAIGFINIMIAYGIRVINGLKEDNLSDKLAPLAWFLFVTSLVASLAFGTFLPSAVSAGYIFLGITGLSLFVFNSGKNIVSKILSGFGQLYELVAFFADILSFTRLVAVGLSSGIIANVINLLAGLIYEGVGGPVGIILAAVVLIIGHVFNLVLAIFAAYINPLRLNYVEFLPKFYKGEGQGLKPEVLETKYAKISA